MPANLGFDFIRGLVRLVVERLKTVQRTEGIGYREGFLQGPQSPLGGATYALEAYTAAPGTALGYNAVTGCVEAPMISDFSIVPLETGTAQGATSGSLTLRAGASAVDDIYNGQYVFILSGPGACQQAIITDYVGATKIAAVEPVWAVLPTAASVYSIGSMETVAP
jgi:hypothetical protein